jgi:uncharacterized DUF497 family protein
MFGPGNRPPDRELSFEWDLAKNALNVRKHRLSFADAVRIFDGPLVTFPDEREDYGEDRWVAMGLLDPDVVVIVYVEPDENIVRVISARKANRREQQIFFENL